MWVGRSGKVVVGGGVADICVIPTDVDTGVVLVWVSRRAPVRVVEVVAVAGAERCAGAGVVLVWLKDVT